MVKEQWSNGTRQRFSRFAAAISYLIIGAVAAAPSRSRAQSAPAPSSAPPQAADGAKPSSEKSTENGNSTSDVVVKGKHKKPSADKDVFSVDRTSVNAADALNNVPGVAVLPTGQVTFYGRNVEIYVDGHPSLLLSGDNRAQALRAMPSGFIQSIEIISTPGAQYDAQGSGSIINIVTNGGIPNGVFGTASGQLSSMGGSDENFSLSANKGKFAASIAASANDDISKSRSAYYLVSPSTGLNTRDDSVSNTRNESQSLSGNIAYNITSQDTIKSALNFNSNYGRELTQGIRYSSIVSGSGPGNYTSPSQSRTDNESLSGSWTHYGNRPDESLDVYGNFARQNSVSALNIPISLGDGSGSYQQENINKNVLFHSEVSADYGLPLRDDQLSVGIKFASEQSAAESKYFYSAAALSNSNLLAPIDSQFRYTQSILALYSTYQVEVGPNFTFLGGVRYEETGLKIYGNDSSIDILDTRYGNLTPDIFATYILSKHQKLKFSITQRLERPSPRYMLPYMDYIDQDRVRIGNPNLRPQKTTIVDTKYDYNYLFNRIGIRLFYSRDESIISPISYAIINPINNSQTLTALSEANSGHRQSFGTDISFSTRLFKKFTMTGTVNTAYLDLRQVPGAPISRAVTTGGILVASYSVSKFDNITAIVNVVGETLNAVGYRRPMLIDNINYSHVITRKINIGLSINNLFRMSKSIVFTETPTLNTKFESDQNSPTILITLSKSFGGFNLPRN